MRRSESERKIVTAEREERWLLPVTSCRLRKRRRWWVCVRLGRVFCMIKVCVVGAAKSSREEDISRFSEALGAVQGEALGEEVLHGTVGVL